MLSGLSVAPPETAHKLVTVVFTAASAPTARPCLALVPPPPPVRVSVMTYWNSRFGDVSYISKHLRAGRTVAAQAGLDWCIAAARQIGLQISGIIRRAGVPHRVELRIDHDGFKTLIFIPEKK
jgi:hypothetical protein